MIFWKFLNESLRIFDHIFHQNQTSSLSTPPCLTLRQNLCKKLKHFLHNHYKNTFNIIFNSFSSAFFPIHRQQTQKISLENSLLRVARWRHKRTAIIRYTFLRQRQIKNWIKNEPRRHGGKVLWPRSCTGSIHYHKHKYKVSSAFAVGGWQSGSNTSECQFKMTF